MSIALVFPGQGSQSVGMLAALAARYALGPRSCFAQASQALGFDLWRLVGRRSGGAAERHRIHAARDAGGGRGDLARLVRAGRRAAGGGGRSQPRANSARWCAPRRCRSRPRCSWFGTAARSCSAPCRRVRARWRRFSASRMPRSKRPAREAAQGEVVEAVNFNSPAQVVIAGHAAAVAARDGAGAGNAAPSARVLLPVSVPAHSSLMRAAAQQLEQRLAADRGAPTALSLHQRRGCAGACRPGGHPGHPGAAARQPGALDRRRCGRCWRWRRPDRVRAGQGAHRPEPPHRARRAAATRSRIPSRWRRRWRPLERRGAKHACLSRIWHW